MLGEGVAVTVLWIHLFSAVLFIGGSFFMWIVVLPASFTLEMDEKARTRVVGSIAKRFAVFTHALLALLIVTGLILAFDWLLPAPSYLLTSYNGKVLLAKMILVVAMILLMYGNNIYHGKRLMALSREGKMEELKKLRKRSHIASYITLAMMIAISVLGAILVM